MLWPEMSQVSVLFFSVFWALVNSDIYKSVMWTTNNPLFSDPAKLSRCFGEDLEMRVHLQSSLPIVCPFDFIIMQTLPSKPATGVLYENFWIVYDKESFDNCDVNTTVVTNGEKNKKLLECDSPEALKSFTYSIDFKAKTPANSGISFVGGQYYYFLATSDGTDGSLNNTAGGHCNDAKVRMKFKVYICRSDVVDERCQNVPIGEFLCPSELPEAPTTFTSQPPLFSTTRNISSISPAITQVTTAQTPKFVENKVNNDESSRPWKTVAIVSIVLLVALILSNIIFWYKTRSKERFRLQSTNVPVTAVNVIPPTSGNPQYQTTSLNPNIHPTQAAVDQPDQQSQQQNDSLEGEPGKPLQAWPGNSAETGNKVPEGKDTEIQKPQKHED